MNYIEFEKRMGNFPLFSTRELKLVFGSAFDRGMLNNLENWKKKGYLVKLKKGLYTLKGLSGLNPMVFASKMYCPSYVSLETALNYYGIIPEAVFSITSITSRETKEYQNNLGRFSFRTIKKEAFGGYETILQKEANISFNLALPEKAIVDFFYLNRNMMDGSLLQFQEYRFNEEFGYDKRRLLKFADYFQNKKVTMLVNNFTRYFAKQDA